MTQEREDWSASRNECEARFCWEDVDRTSNLATTRFKRRARLQQARWREGRGLPIGHEPIKPRAGRDQRALGSRIDYDDAVANGSNFLGAPILQAVQARLAKRETREMLKEERLYADLLSSMPMCFNLFGWAWGDAEEQSRVADVLVRAATDKSRAAAIPGRAESLRFEWSPGRFDPEYLNNGTAFDAAFLLGPARAPAGILGVETKYHEHCFAEPRPKPGKERRYREVAAASGVFKAGAEKEIIGSELQQIWLDHLLVLSMLQHRSLQWSWGRFVIVYPAKNPSIGDAVGRYSDMLADSATFGSVTLEALLAAGALDPISAGLFSERYLW